MPGRATHATGYGHLSCFAFPSAAARQPVMAAYARIRGIPARALRSYRQLTVVTIRLVLTLWPMVAG